LAQIRTIIAEIQISTFYVCVFTHYIKDSYLGGAPSPSLTVDDLFTGYNTVLRTITDRFA